VRELANELGPSEILKLVEGRGVRAAIQQVTGVGEVLIFWLPETFSRRNFCVRWL
jgi:hypothetical protein